MASILKIIVLVFVTGFAYGQTAKTVDAPIQNITFKFDRKIYDKMAADSIKVLYQRQYIYCTTGDIWPYVQESSISLHYKFEELTFFAIPRFRLFREAADDFNCSENIENYIAFEEYNKFQKVIVSGKGRVLCQVAVPNDLFERDRQENPSIYKSSSTLIYETNYLQSLCIGPESKGYYDKIFVTGKDNFFFEIYELEDVLFEIDTKTGLLYANYYGYMFGPDAWKRILANDFIRKYIGDKRIKVLASGNPDQIGYELVELPIPCAENTKGPNPVFLKVKEAK